MRRKRVSSSVRGIENQREREKDKEEEMTFSNFKNTEKRERRKKVYIFSLPTSSPHFLLRAQSLSASSDCRKNIPNAGVMISAVRAETLVAAANGRTSSVAAATAAPESASAARADLLPASMASLMQFSRFFVAASRASAACWARSCCCCCCWSGVMVRRRREEGGGGRGEKEVWEM